MSGQTNNPDPDSYHNDRDASNKQLKEFLSKNSEQADDLFDKDALEGFATLDHEQEAFEMKAALDEKIKNNLFLADKKRTKKYWLAAAGFLLVVGLSVYFISNSAPHQKNLAVSEKKETPVEQLPMSDSSTPVLKEKNEELEKQNPVKTLVVTRAPKKDSGPSNAGYSHNALKTTQEALGLALAGGAARAEEIASAPAKAENYDVQAKGDDIEGVDKKEKDQMNNPVPPERELSGKTLAKRKELKNAAAGTPARSAANNGNIEEPISKEKYSRNAYYPGGEETLNKTLKKKLVKKECDQKFDAMLFIDKNGKVEKVELTRTYELTAKQQKQIIDILKSLGNFRFYSSPANNTLSEYKVFYQK